jgi:hypothetical protein
VIRYSKEPYIDALKGWLGKRITDNHLKAIVWERYLFRGVAKLEDPDTEDDYIFKRRFRTDPPREYAQVLHKRPRMLFHGMSPSFSNTKS